jgi:hypothetical protein
MNVKRKKKKIVLHIFVKQTNDACNIILLCVVLVSSFGSSNYVNNIFLGVFLANSFTCKLTKQKKKNATKRLSQIRIIKSRRGN